MQSFQLFSIESLATMYQTDKASLKSLHTWPLQIVTPTGALWFMIWGCKNKIDF